MSSHMSSLGAPHFVQERLLEVGCERTGRCAPRDFSSVPGASPPSACSHSAGEDAGVQGQALSKVPTSKSPQTGSCGSGVHEAGMLLSFPAVGQVPSRIHNERVRWNIFTDPAMKRSVS